MAALERPEKVLLLIDDPVQKYSDLIRGLVDYFRNSRHLELVYRGIGVPNLSQELRIHKRLVGIVGRICSDANIAGLRKLRIPVVLMEQDSVANKPVVRVDNQAIGKAAYSHFAARGYRMFAYLGSPTHQYSDLREAGFLGSAQAAGHQIHLQPQSRFGGRIPRTKVFARGYMERWLATLPRPLAMLVDTSMHARQLASVCREMDIRVPEDMAIIAGDNDELHCDTGVPALSAVDQRFREIGYRTAQVIHDLIMGKKLDSQVITVTPGGIVERQSTDALAIDDDDLAAALNYIRLNATRSAVTAEELAQHVAVSVRTLHTLFRIRLGRSVHDEITRVRIERAKSLLLTTNMSMLDVAFSAGYASAAVFNRAFSRRTGLTPTEYRRSTKRTKHHPRS